MKKIGIPVVQPLAVPEPCVIDELPEVVTVVEEISLIWCTPDVVTDRHGHVTNPLLRWVCVDSVDEIRYVAGVE